MNVRVLCTRFKRIGLNTLPEPGVLMYGPARTSEQIVINNVMTGESHTHTQIHSITHTHTDRRRGASEKSERHRHNEPQIPPPPLWLGARSPLVAPKAIASHLIVDKLMQPTTMLPNAAGGDALSAAAPHQ